MTDTIAQAFASIEEKIAAIFAEVKATPIVAAVETDIKTAGLATLNYVEKNGLQAAYQIALSVVAAATAGTPWGVIISAIETQALAAGKTLASGAGSILAAQAQADLVALGTIAAPASTPAA